MSDIWRITSPEARFSEDAIYLFKKTVSLEAPKSAMLNITADARYKLRINGQTVCFGPYKSNGSYRHYDRVDITKYLHSGENEIFVEVMQLCSPDDVLKYKHLTSVTRSGNLLLLMWGEVECADGVHKIVTDGSWQCAKDRVEFFRPPYSFYLGTTVRKSFCGELSWQAAREVDRIEQIASGGELRLWELKSHDLPLQRYELQPFTHKDSAGNYDFGRMTTAFVRAKAKGKGKLRIMCSECYVFTEDGKELKCDRADTKGIIKGDYDIIELDGECTYESFWFRTFRFIKVDALEGDAELVSLEVAETGYPLNVHNDYDFGNEADNRLWEICVNTLKNCMHETYEDCPYHEQLQYAMDTYLQMLFTMRLTDDIRLVKQGIDSFATSLVAGNIVQCRTPSVKIQYIVGFSLYFIYMLDSLEKNRGEHSFIRRYLGTVDNIITAFRDMKREDGLLAKGRYWSFVDWAEGWQNGEPPSEAGDSLTVYDLMYAVALENAARLCRIYGRNDTAAEYENEAKEIKALVKAKCYSEEVGLYADTDKKQTYSQHSQVWAVLAGLDGKETQQRILHRSVELESKGGFAFSYLTLRAFEAADAYELSEDLMEQYRGLVALNCTTVPETPTEPRSECHAWGAVSINEMTSMVLGVKEADDIILIKPYVDGRSFAKGTVYTKQGSVYVKWEKESTFKISVKAESDKNIKLILPNQEIIKGRGEITCSCQL